MEAILDKAKNQFSKNLPFAVFSKPNSDIVMGLFQQNDILYSVIDYTEKGFVFASFDGSKTLLIPENQSEITAVTWSKEEVNFIEREYDVPDEASQEDFEKLITKGIEAIESGEFKKVVLSRKETVDLVDFNFAVAFEKLVHLYPATFVYCFFHPKVGMWLGATPEQLLKANVNVFETVALAGTQKDRGLKDIVWGEKEKEEQQYVTDYIVSTLKDVAMEISVTKPYSVKAGSIWHIKTDIWGVLNSGSSLKQVISLLHPTPAVCGLPKDHAKAFILKNENYDRTFYTGFLGELNSSFAIDSVSSDLFVNLRCMQIEIDPQLAKTKAYLYMGCGVTKESIPEQEWVESVNKSTTMKRVL